MPSLDLSAYDCSLEVWLCLLFFLFLLIM